MSLSSFVVFRDGRLARAGRQPAALFGRTIVFNGGRFERGQKWCHQYHHVIDNQRRLLGFQLDLLSPGGSASVAWRRWVASCENCSLADSEFAVLLVEQLPEVYYSDSASIVGGDVYHNGKGEFIVTIPDLSNVKTEEANWDKMWDTMAFDLAPVTVEPESD